MKHLLIICITLISFSGMAQLDMNNIRNQAYLKHQTAVDCEQAETTIEMRICANLKLQKNDSLMWLNIKEYEYKLNEEGRNNIFSLFMESQHKWDEFRTTHCAIYFAQYDGGSLAPIIYLNCLAKQTEQRTESIKALIEAFDK